MPDLDPQAVAHSERFRRVSNRYPRRVAEAYEGDLARAMADTDEQVAATVAVWEKSEDTVARDWTAQGLSEREGEDQTEVGDDEQST
jgi:hypothetical protein